LMAGVGDYGLLGSLRESDSEVKDADGRWKSNVRGTYKTRRDIEFCKDRPCRQKYSYRKTAGWPAYG